MTRRKRVELAPMLCQATSAMTDALARLQHDLETEPLDRLVSGGRCHERP